MSVVVCGDVKACFFCTKKTSWQLNNPTDLVAQSTLQPYIVMLRRDIYFALAVSINGITMEKLLSLLAVLIQLCNGTIIF